MLFIRPQPHFLHSTNIHAALVTPQARIVALNSHYYLKNGGNCVISIKASCVDSTASPEAVFAQEVCPVVVSCASSREIDSSAG